MSHARAECGVLLAKLGKMAYPLKTCRSDIGEGASAKGSSFGGQSKTAKTISAANSAVFISAKALDFITCPFAF